MSTTQLKPDQIKEIESAKKPNGKIDLSKVSTSTIKSMLSSDIQMRISDIVQSELPSGSPAEVVAYLFQRNLIDKNKCRYALIRKRFIELTYQRSCLTSKEIKELVAEDFNVSVGTVERAIYYYSELNL